MKTILISIDKDPAVRYDFPEGTLIVFRRMSDEPNSILDLLRPDHSPLHFEVEEDCMVRLE